MSSCVHHSNPTHLRPPHSERVFAIPDGVGVGGYSFKRVRRVKDSILNSPTTFGIYKKGSLFVESDNAHAVITDFDYSVDVVDLPGDIESYSVGASTILFNGASKTLIYKDNNDIIATILGFNDSGSIYLI